MIEYWVCPTVSLKVPKPKWWQPKHPKIDAWGTMYLTAEDALAFAKEPNEVAVWDGTPPMRYSLGAALRFAKEHQMKGILIRTRENGEWVTVEKFTND